MEAETTQEVTQALQVINVVMSGIIIPIARDMLKRLRALELRQASIMGALRRKGLELRDFDLDDPG